MQNVWSGSKSAVTLGLIKVETLTYFHENEVKKKKIENGQLKKTD